MSIVVLHYRGYTRRVEFDDEAEDSYGEVIDLRGVVTFQGTRVGGLKEAFRDSVDCYRSEVLSRYMQIHYAKMTEMAYKDDPRDAEVHP